MESSRLHLANAIEKYVSGNTNSHEFADILDSASCSGDELAQSISEMCTVFIDSFECHKNSGDYEIQATHEEILSRWKTLLKIAPTSWNPTAERRSLISTAIEVVAGKPKFLKQPYWPFGEKDEWDAFEKANG